MTSFHLVLCYMWWGNPEAPCHMHWCYERKHSWRYSVCTWSEASRYTSMLQCSLWIKMVCWRLDSGKVQNKEAAIEGVLQGKIILKILQNWKENTCIRAPFLIMFKAWSLQLYKKREKETSTHVFSCINFA